MFDKDIDLRDDTLHIFRSYYIKNAYVKLLDPKHRIETHQYQWILNSWTIFEKIPDDEQPLEPPKYNIVPFSELDAYKYSIAKVGNLLFDILKYLIINRLRISILFARFVSGCNPC